MYHDHDTTGWHLRGRDLGWERCHGGGKKAVVESDLDIAVVSLKCSSMAFLFVFRLLLPSIFSGSVSHWSKKGAGKRLPCRFLSIP